MDVRCDLCQTEYELDDDSVSDAGASVQCTTCGHTFVVGRNGVALSGPQATHPSAGAPPSSSGPAAADWLLATEDGQTHRFRDLTTLQKWIVERKVTREDRVSQKGGRWRPLSEVSELEPFFEVVSQADRARSAELAGRAAVREPAVPSSGKTPTRQTLVPHQTAARMRKDTGGMGVPAARPSSPSGRTDSGRSRVLLEPENLTANMPVEDSAFETVSILSGQRNFKLVGGAAILVLAALAAYVGFKRPYWLFGKAPEAPRLVESPPAPAPIAAPGGSAAPATAAPTVAAAPVAATPSGRGPGAPVTAPSRPIIEAMPPSPGARPAPAERAAGGGDPAASGKGKSYERLVADADRLLENGQTARAQKLVDEALALQPDGVAAITTSAYLLLDKEKHLSAISAFKRALGLSPSYAPAMFGLAEAYRARGDGALAADNYRKYLGLAPGGADASAARRQLKELEAAAPKRAAPEEPSSESAKLSGESAKLEERAAPSGDQPAP